jgi:hypothetical protein
MGVKLGHTLREECMMRVLENRMLRMYESKRDKVKGEWRKLYNAELHDLCPSHNISQKIK